MAGVLQVDVDRLDVDAAALTHVRDGLPGGREEKIINKIMPLSLLYETTGGYKIFMKRRPRCMHIFLQRRRLATQSMKTKCFRQQYTYVGCTPVILLAN